MNAIVNKVIEKRNGHYCHALEVSDLYELQSAVDSLYNEFTKDGFTKDEIIEFFESLELYCLEDENEDEIFSFIFADYINNL